MSRLTYELGHKGTGEYEPNPHSIPINDYISCINKLGKLEDIEKDLGCPLEVREKAFDNGFYDVDGNYYTCEHYVPYLKSMHTRGIMRGREKHFNLEDYKKTWWLSKTKKE